MNKECPVYVFNKECNEIMANSNVDYKTAVNLHAKKIKFAQTVLSKIDTTENIVEALMKQFDTNKIFVKTLVKKVLSDIKWNCSPFHTPSFQVDKKLQYYLQNDVQNMLWILFLLQQKTLVLVISSKNACLLVFPFILLTDQ